MQTLPMILSGTRLNVNFAPITTLESVEVAFQNRDKDFPFYISMEFHVQKAKLDVKMNGTWQHLFYVRAWNDNPASRLLLAFGFDLDLKQYSISSIGRPRASDSIVK
ncbi:hypothetical protein DPMN_140997 [Dreissena polymorpha]|uniref:Uncharacterized protein n=1 Tax=Dreissena polymorpha TaxID=45954 RepID=A0A9D4G953_DREPO|nr:hypothetical protein DPMN_140997 [Dreissena polymorpha]